MTVREIIRACCKDAGITLTDLAERVGMSQSNLSKAISRGADGTEGEGMRASTLIKLVEAAGGEILVETQKEEYYLDGCNEMDEDEENQAFPH